MKKKILLLYLSVVAGAFSGLGLHEMGHYIIAYFLQLNPELVINFSLIIPLLGVKYSCCNMLVTLGGILPLFIGLPLVFIKNIYLKIVGVALILAGLLATLIPIPPIGIYVSDGWKIWNYLIWRIVI